LILDPVKTSDEGNISWVITDDIGDAYEDSMHLTIIPSTSSGEFCLREIVMCVAVGLSFAFLLKTKSSNYLPLAYVY
jgi:hypothetical protein